MTHTVNTRAREKRVDVRCVTPSARACSTLSSPITLSNRACSMYSVVLQLQELFRASKKLLAVCINSQQKCKRKNVTLLSKKKHISTPSASAPSPQAARGEASALGYRGGPARLSGTCSCCVSATNRLSARHAGLQARRRGCAPASRARRGCLRPRAEGPTVRSRSGPSGDWAAVRGGQVAAK